MEKRRSSFKTQYVLFFLFAVACVVAFLIVILVKSCEADHEEDKLLEQEEQITMVTPHVITLDTPLSIG